MNTTTFIQALSSGKNRNLQFTLPDEAVILGDLHITEIQHHSVNSVDCGGNSHSYHETVVQLSLNERSKSVAKWTTDKAIKIIDTVGQNSNFKDDAELLIEFGDSDHPAIRYSVSEIEEKHETVAVQMAIKPTVCKPSLNVDRKLVGCC